MPDGFVDFGRAGPYLAIAYGFSFAALTFLYFSRAARLNRLRQVDAEKNKQEEK